MTQQGPQTASDLTRAFLVGYASIAAVIVQLTRLVLSTSASNGSPLHVDPARSMKSRWANRLVRQAISQEIHELRRQDTPLPLLGPQHGAAITPLNLPSDPAHGYYGRSGSSKEPCAKHSSDSRRRTGVGLPPRKVCIVGAGIAGLYIAMILDDLKIPSLEYEILEASERIGGRVYTHRFSDEKHDYYDVGAMRYPNIPTMKRVFDLFRRTKVPLLRYCLHGGESCPHLFNDRRLIAGERDSCRVGVANGGMVPDDVVDDVDHVLDKAFGPYKMLLRDDFEAGFEKLMTVDDFSTREFLRSGGPSGTERRYSFHVVQWMETQNTSTGLFDQAFSESVMDSFDFDDASGDIDWYCIDGGTSELVQRIQRCLETQPETNKRVRGIHIDRSSSADGNMSVHVAGEAEARSGYSAVFSTTTLGCLLKMDTSSLDLHPVQKDAIRTLHYDESAKVALQFSYPWWIVDCGIRTGGTSSTDLPLRTCIYPSYNLQDGHDKPAILLASYTWAQDATRLGSMISNATDEGSTQPRVPAPSEEELIDLILQSLARLHAGKMTYEKLRAAFTGVYHAWAWQNDPFAAGAFAFYSPGQFSHLYPYLTRPAADSKFHIVGEAASAHHGWVAGSLNSAYGAVLKFLYRYRLWEYMALMEERWGVMDEIECGEHGTVHLQVALGMLTRDRTASV